MGADRFFANPAVGRHMGGGYPGGETSEEEHPAAGGQKPHIFIHSHAKGHTVHIHHANGDHEKHEHAHGDAAGIAEHIHRHLGEERAEIAHGGGEGASPEGNE